MNHAKEASVHPDNDFFIVRERIAEEHARAQAEKLARIVGRVADSPPGSGRSTGARAWLGRRLVAVGTLLAGESPAAEPRPTTGQPC